MTHSHASKARIKANQIDALLERAQAEILELYPRYYKNHPDLALDLEHMLYELADTRLHLRRWHFRCWGFGAKTFHSAFDTETLIAEIKRLNGSAKCLKGAYLADWELSADPSLIRLLRPDGRLATLSTQP